MSAALIETMTYGTAEKLPDAKERPILFSAPMVRALLDGGKTQTRRVVKRPKGCPADYVLDPAGLITPGDTWWRNPEFDRVGWSQRCPYGVPGDLLWVREQCWLAGGWVQNGVRANGRPAWTFCTNGRDVRYDNPGHELIAYQGGTPGWGWRPSIHMPRWASRLLLEVTEVRVERLQDISRADAAAEGLVKLPATGRYVVAKGDQYFGGASHDPREVYSWLWDSINGVGSWDANPWVWAVSFKLVKA